MNTPRPKPIEEGSAPQMLGSPWLDHDNRHPADAAFEHSQAVDEVGPVDPTAHLDLAPLVELPCAEPDCTATLPVNAAHVDNLDGWLCRRHKDVTA